MMLWSLLLLATGCLAKVRVHLDTGLVEGRRVKTHYDNTYVNSFKGIPYGKPPIGELRFAPPEPAEPWDGVFHATHLGRACMQAVKGWLWLTHPGFKRLGEDCLNLNVFTPHNMVPDKAYPVMIFFHGGGFVAGGNIQYPGHFLAARDVIVVVPNYRLNVFGFASTEDSVSPGNQGLLDQNLAMQWVQRNIAVFGGDPHQVTLFGQSAGAASSSFHIMSPKSEGLFHQIIGQSGTDMSFWGMNFPHARPATYTQQTAAKNGCPQNDSRALIACLRDVDAKQLYSTGGVTCTPGHFCQGHAPVVDGPGGFLPERPDVLRAQGKFNKDINVMAGYNSEDGSLYTMIVIPESRDGGFNRSRWQHHLRNSLLSIWAPQFDDLTNENVYQAADFFYTPWPYLEDMSLNRAKFNDIITDAAFGYVCEKQLLSQSRHSHSNYMYQFGYRSNATLVDHGIWKQLDWIGVPHSAEVPYMFGWALMKKAPMVRADAGFLLNIMKYNEEDFAYAEFMMDLWANFAKYGNPTPEPMADPLGNSEPVMWEKFTEEERNILVMKRDVYPSKNYRCKENAFFAEYASYLVNRPLSKQASSGKPSSPGLESDVISKGQEELVREFLLEEFPLEFEHLFDE